MPPKVRHIAVDDVYLVSIAATILRQAQRIRFFCERFKVFPGQGFDKGLHG